MLNKLYCLIKTNRIYKLKTYMQLLLLRKSLFSYKKFNYKFFKINLFTLFKILNNYFLIIQIMKLCN